jgi:hypothetical protein
MANMAMRQHTFIGFICFLSGEVNKPRHPRQHIKLINVCCHIAMFAIYENFN